MGAEEATGGHRSETGAIGPAVPQAERKSVSRTEKVLIVDADTCTGCSVCELVCSMTKYGEYNPRKSYIRVLKNREMSVRHRGPRHPL